MQLDEVLSIGTSKYGQYGASDLKCRVVISVDTLFEHCSTFYELKIALHPLPAIDLNEVLFRIRRTRCYHLTASWIVLLGSTSADLRSVHVTRDDPYSGSDIEAQPEKQPHCKPRLP